MESITVTIPAQDFSLRKYSMSDNCYLAEALKKVLPLQNIKVGSFGNTLIDAILYKPTESFNIDRVIEAFKAGQDIKVTLKKLKNEPNQQ